MWLGPSSGRRTISGSNLKLDPEMVLLLAAPEPPIGKGSGVLMGRVFSENLTQFLEIVALFLGQNGGPFWVKMGSFLESKWGNY